MGTLSAEKQKLVLVKKSLQQYLMACSHASNVADIKRVLMMLLGLLYKSGSFVFVTWKKGSHEDAEVRSFYFRHLHCHL